MSYGTTKISAKKSLEGSLAMLTVCCIIGLGIFWEFQYLEYVIFCGSLSATLAELIPGIDDNITIPLISAVVMKLAIMRTNNSIPQL